MAKPLKMDFSKFKHLKSDDKTTTLQHKDGHTITLAHQALGKEMQAALGALKGIATDAQTPMQRDEESHKAASPRNDAPSTMASGGSVDKYNDKAPGAYADGGEVSSAPPRSESPEDPNVPKGCRVVSQGGGFGKVIVCDAEGGKVEMPLHDKAQPKHCMNCGGPLKMASGGDVPSFLAPNQDVEVPAALAPSVVNTNTQLSEDPYGISKATEGAPVKQDAQPEVEGDPSQLSKDVGAVGGWLKDKLMPGEMKAVTGSTLTSSEPTNQPPAELPDKVNVGEELVKAGAAPEMAASPNTSSEPAPSATAAAAPAPVDSAPQGKTFEQHHAEQLSNIQNEDLAYQKALATQQIKPETYQSLFAKKDTVGKLGTLFGLLVGGFGAGLTHTENPVIEQMKQTIENDLNAQKTSAENAQNIYRLTQGHELQKAQIGLMGAQTKNAIAEANVRADALARLRANRTALQVLVNQTNKFPPGSPQRQQAEQQLAMLSGVVNNENYGIAERAATQGALMNYIGSAGDGDSEAAFKAKNQALRLSGREELAKDRESKHVPGIGDSTRPVTEENRNKLLAHQQLEQAAQNLQDFIKTHGGLLNRMSPNDRAKAAALVLPVQAAFREGTLNTVYREGEQPLLDKAVKGQPLDLASYFINTEPTKINTMLETNRQQFNKLKAAVGLPVSTESPLEGRTIVNKSTGQRMVMKNGKWTEAP